MLYECVVKTGKNLNNEIIWKAFYVKNVKIFENEDFDIDFLINKFSINKKWKEIFVTANDIMDNKENYFPIKDDFTYLMDYQEIEIGKTVYMYDGIHYIKKFWYDYRPSGLYDVFVWEKIGELWYAGSYKQEMSGHQVIKFEVEGSTNIFIWEDYNYQQSFLYLNFFRYKN